MPSDVWNTVRLPSQVIVKHPEDILNGSAEASHPEHHPHSSATSHVQTIVNGSFNLEYKVHIAIFPNQTCPLLEAVTLGMFLVERCCAVTAMCKVPAHFFIIHGASVKLNLPFTVPSFILTLTEPRFAGSGSLWVR